jgi:hypothetical protein
MTLFARLFWWRLRYFRQTSFRLLERRWQVVLLSILALAPAAMPLREQLRLLGRPVSIVVEAGHTWLSAACWLAILAIARAWTGLQANALLGGPGWRHLRSLPMVSGRGRWVDLAVLAAADLPLLLPFAAAIITAGPQHEFVLPAVLAMLAFALQLPVFQYLQLQRMAGSLPCLGIDLAGIAAAGTGADSWWLSCAAAAACASGIVFLARAPAQAARADRSLPAWLRLQSQRRLECNLALVNLRFLLGSGRAAQRIRLLACALLPVLLYGFLLQTSIPASGPSAVAAVLVSLGLPPLILCLSSLASELRGLHAPMLAMHRTMGIRNVHLQKAQLLVLAATFCLLCVPLMLTLCQASPSGYHAWHVLALLPVGIMALAACCWLMQFSFNRVYILRIGVAALACYATLQCFPD